MDEKINFPGIFPESFPGNFPVGNFPGISRNFPEFPGISRKFSPEIFPSEIFPTFSGISCKVPPEIFSSGSFLTFSGKSHKIFSKTVPGLLDVREHGPCLVDPTEVLALHVPQQYFEVGDLPLQLQTQLLSATTTVASRFGIFDLINFT